MHGERTHPETVYPEDRMNHPSEAPCKPSAAIRKGPGTFRYEDRPDGTPENYKRKQQAHPGSTLAKAAINLHLAAF